MRSLLILAGCILASAAMAHQAPTGWEYPRQCCDGTDCRVIEESALRLNKDGSYTILATGETFYPPGVEGPVTETFSMYGSPVKLKAKNFKWSPDSEMHRCSQGFPGRDTGSTYCLFIPVPSI